MSREEAIANLGTIAKSGTAEFLSKLSGDRKKDAALIGQFGVGFYSAFIVADTVDVLTRRADEPADAATRWRSSGEADFTVAADDKADARHRRHVASERRCEGVRRRVSAAQHRAQVFRSHRRRRRDGQGDVRRGRQESEEEAKRRGSSGRPSTRRRRCGPDRAPRSPTTNTRNSTNTSRTTSTIRRRGATTRSKANSNTRVCLYVPKHAPFDLWNRDAPRGLKLYVQRVYILDQAEQFLPLYLRFIKGVLDSNDLPLNVSRELLQQDERVQTIKSALTKRVLDMLAKLANVGPRCVSKLLQRLRRSAEGRAGRGLHESRSDCEAAALLVDAYRR